MSGLIDKGDSVRISSGRHFAEFLFYYMEIETPLVIEYRCAVKGVMETTFHKVHPIVTALGRELNKTTPLEYGSWDPDMYYLKAYSYEFDEERFFRLDNLTALILSKEEVKSAQIGIYTDKLKRLKRKRKKTDEVLQSINELELKLKELL